MDFKQYIKENIQTNYKIFVDLDGVLVNLGKHIKQFNLGTFEEIDAQKNSGTLWKMIEAQGPEFWSHAPWMKDGMLLWGYVKKYNPSILTAVPATGKKPAKVGKEQWVKRELGSFVNCIITEAKLKQQYAGPNCILIDDMVKNCDQWTKAGGIAIRHINTKDTISQLKLLSL